MENLARQRVVADAENWVDAPQEEEQDIGSENPKKRGRGVTINTKLANKKAKGTKLDVIFPQPFGKVCGKHAKLFKAKVTVCVRQFAPLKFDDWKKIPDDDIQVMWRFLKDRLNLSEDDHANAMKQVRRQYHTRLFNLHKAFREKKGRPNHVSPEDWQWLIRNKWNTRKFKDMSNRNKLNRSKQEMKSITGTKSIVQKAHEMKDPESGEWPSAMDVWKATRMKPNGTWSTPNGEETLKNLEDIGNLYKEEISSAPIPLVEHFALVLGRKRSHSRGVGVGAISVSAQEKQHMQARLIAEQKKAQALEAEVERLTETTKKQDEAYTQLQANMETQCFEMEANVCSLREQMPQKIQDEVQRQMSVIFATIASGKSVISLQSSAPAEA